MSIQPEGGLYSVPVLDEDLDLCKVDVNMGLEWGAWGRGRYALNDSEINFFDISALTLC